MALHTTWLHGYHRTGSIPLVREPVVAQHCYHISNCPSLRALTLQKTHPYKQYGPVSSFLYPGILLLSPPQILSSDSLACFSSVSELGTSGNGSSGSGSCRSNSGASQPQPLNLSAWHLSLSSPLQSSTSHVGASAGQHWQPLSWPLALHFKPSFLTGY
jgi:hypothetical protein